MSQWWGTLL